MAETQFFMEKEEITERIKKMWKEVSDNLKLALKALKKTDPELACKVIKREKSINKLHIEIERETVTFMATQQPVASNLRALVSVFKMSRSFERIGDYAVHIAKEGRRLAEVTYPGDITILESMIETGTTMLDDVIIAFEKQDTDMARDIASRDDLVDARHKEFIADIVSTILEDAGNADVYTRLVSTVNSVERLCDHITDICESIVYMNECRYVDLNEK